MSSASSHTEQSKKRERTESEIDQPDGAKRAKIAESQVPTHNPQAYASYSTYAQQYPMNYGHPSQYTYAQPGTAGYGYGYPQSYYGAQPSMNAGVQTKSSHATYSTYYPAAGSDPLAAPSADYDPLAPPKPESGANEAEDKKHLRYAAGHVWEDKTLAEWPDNDFRIHVGNLGKEVDDKTLHEAFKKYPTLAHWKVVFDRRTTASKGYGFVSFLDPREGLKALKEMNTKYIGQRPCKLTKSTHDKRDYDSSKKKR